MTFAELYAAAVELVPDCSIAVQVEAWHYADGRARLDWSIWVESHHKHYTSTSPAAVLEMLRAAVDHGLERDVDVATIDPVPEVAA